MRYTVIRFPGYLGSAWRTNSWLLSRAFAVIYWAKYGTTQVRIWDEELKTYTIWWRKEP